MNLHEYQAKQVFASYGMPVPNNQVVESASAVSAALDKLAGDRWVVKAQVHAGGRGKAGGVKLLDSAAAVTQAVDDMLGTSLVTYQTNAQGQPINQVLIEEISNISRELYLGAVIDRASQRVVIMASTEGGM
jgi:succinyl-CoA synthetase beta subunit